MTNDRKQSGEAVGTEPLRQIERRLHAATMRGDWGDLPDNALVTAVPLLRDAAEVIRAYLSQPEQPAKEAAAFERGLPHAIKRVGEKQALDVNRLLFDLSNDKRILLMGDDIRGAIRDAFATAVAAYLSQPEQPALAAVGEPKAWAVWADNFKENYSVVRAKPDAGDGWNFEPLYTTPPPSPMQAERDKLRAAISWLEPPFVDEQTPFDELRLRVKYCVGDANRATFNKDAE